MGLTIGIFVTGLVYYAAQGLAGLVFLLGLTAVSYSAALWTSRRRGLAWLGIAAGAGALLACRLVPLMGGSWLAPLGASYYTLRLISYNADVYRGKYPPERRFWRLGLYASFLPALFLGPIDRYDRFSQEAFSNRRITWDGISQGAARAAWGLFKKLTIAARAGVVIRTIAADPEQYRGAYALLAMVLYSFQLYADFSGGIDMALGVSQMLGIRLPENFNKPFTARSVSEFWRRWHMSLGAWLRDYVYIPLGGNRKGTVRKYVNVVLTFLVSGFWHGANYLAWGALNGVLVALGDRFRTKAAWFDRLLTGLLVSLLWAFFIWPDTASAFAMLASVVRVFNYGALLSNLGGLGLDLGEGVVFVLALGALWLCGHGRERLQARFLGWSPARRTAAVCALGLMTLIFGMYGIGFDAEAFIYSRF